MIFVKLKGGFGNQLFQYAAAKQISIQTNMPIVWDLGFYDSQSFNHTNRTFELGQLKLKAEIVPTVDPFDLRQMKFFLLLNRVNEKNYWWKRHFIKALKYVYLSGYWQSEKYFSTIKDVLRVEFVFKRQLDDSFNDIRQQIESTNSVSLHFRRGDYVTDLKTNKYHGITSLDYYYRAIEFVSKLTTEFYLFVFSDDIDWVKANFVTNHPIVYVDRKDEENHSDFQLMSLCKHNIIANSSYSWWAAWLNDNPNKIIVAPRKWYANKRKQKKLKDRIPSSWFRL